MRLGFGDSKSLTKRSQELRQHAQAIRVLWVAVMRSLTYILVWAALAGAPEVLLTVIIDLIAKTLARAARYAPRAGPPPGLAPGCAETIEAP